MARTQINGDQILDATISASDLASESVTPAKISAVATDDFSFPRDVSAGRDLKVADNNKLVFKTDNTAWIKYSSDHNALLFESTSGASEFDAPGPLYFYSNTGPDGSGPYTGLSFESNSSVYFLINDSGNFSGSQFATYVNKGVASGDHYNNLFKRLDSESPLLGIGYHANGTVVDKSILNSGFPISLRLSNTEIAALSSTRASLVGIDLSVSDDKKVILGNSDNAFVKYDSAADFILWQQDASGTTQFTSNGEFDLYANTGPNFTGSFSPALEMYATGQMWLRNDGTQGSEGDRFVKIKFDDGFTAGFHGVQRLSLSSDTDWLQLGYDADGSVRTGTRIRGENLTVESLSPLNLVATRVQVSEDLAVNDTKKVILGNSDQAWFKYSTDVGGIVGKTTDSNNAFSFYFGAEGGLHLYSNVLNDGSGTYQPSLNIYDDGRVDLRNCQPPQGGATTNSRLAIQFDQGVDASDHDQVWIQRTTEGGEVRYMSIGYRANGSGVTAALIQSRDSKPLVLGTLSTPSVITLLDDGTIDANSHKITNISDPTSDQDAATKAYVDANMGGGGGGLTGTVSTTDATPTTILTIPTVTDNTIYFEVVVIGTRTGGAGGNPNDTIVALLKAKYKNVADTVTLFGTDSSEIDEDNANTDVTLSISGTDVLVQVTGDTDNNYDWTATTIYPSSGGGGDITYPLFAPDGTEATPQYAFDSNHGTGLSMAGNTIALSINALAKVYFNTAPNTSTIEVISGGILIDEFGSTTNPSVKFGSSGGSTGFYSITQDNVGFSSNGTETSQLTTLGIGLSVDGDEINPSLYWSNHAGWGIYYDNGFNAIGMSTGAGKALTLDNTGALTVYQGTGGFVLDALMKLWSDNQAVYLDNTSAGRGGAPLLIVRDSTETVFYNLNDSSLDMVSKPIINLTDPTNPQDAATKAYVDAAGPTVATVTTASYTAAADHIILADATSNAITVNLPAASGNSGMQYVIKKIDSSANTVTLDPNASETIDGVTTYVLTAQYEALTIICDGSNWFII